MVIGLSNGVVSRYKPRNNTATVASDRRGYPTDADREQFGRTLSRWINRNGWIHSTLHQWGESSGFPSVRDSTFNRLQNAKIEQPAPITFIQLGIANEKIAAAEFEGVTDRQLKDRLVDSEAICSSNGKPWRATEFFGHFCGQVDAPEWAVLQAPLTQERCDEITEHHRKLFGEITAKKKLDRADAWEQLKIHCLTLTKAQKELLKDILSGWKNWTPANLENIPTTDCGNINAENCPVNKALAEWDRSD